MVNLLQTLHQPLTTRTRSWGSKHQQIFQSISVYTWGAKVCYLLSLFTIVTHDTKNTNSCFESWNLVSKRVADRKNPHCQSEANCSVGSNKTKTKNNMKILVLTLRVSTHEVWDNHLHHEYQWLTAVRSHWLLHQLLTVGVDDQSTPKILDNYRW